VQDSLNGFSQLIAPDLDDDERIASEKLAQLSVSNWGEGHTNLAPDVGLDDSDESASDAEQDKVLPSGTAQAAGEPEFEDKLTPGEVLDLLEHEFGALAPPGEEKLLVETDATIFQDVVILVCP
jgi:sterol 3beta-glucosyltransferase